MPCLNHPPVRTQDPSVWDLPSGHEGPYWHSKRMQVGVGSQINQPILPLAVGCTLWLGVGPRLSQIPRMSKHLTSPEQRSFAHLTQVHILPGCQLNTSHLNPPC